MAASTQLMTVGALGVVAVALAGLLLGFGRPQPGWQPPEVHRPEAPASALPAVPYLQMDGKERGPNRLYQSHLSTLVQHRPDPMAPVQTDPVLRAEVVARRAARRAYAGAPPTIPHPVDANDVASCYQCHGEGTVIDTVVAPKISHQRYTNCTQCHALGSGGATAAVGPHVPLSGSPAASTPPDPPGFRLNVMPDFGVENRFAGQVSNGKGSRAYAGAPPTVPHPLNMRENCTACHGTLGLDGLKTPHPWRVNCLQCHVPDAKLDQRAGGDPSPPPWAGETLAK